MNITDRILKTIKKIALDKNKPEDAVTWNEIAIEQAIELNDLFALREVDVVFKDKNAELSELANNLIKEIQETHPLMYMPKDEKLYMALHKLKEAIKDSL